MASVSINGRYARLWSAVFVIVQLLVAVAGFLMANTLAQMQGTLTTINAQLYAHEGRISRLEGRHQGLGKGK